MTNRFIAEATSLTDDGYSTLLGFADNPATPVNYVTLNMTNEPDAQDLRLRQGGVHIDAGALHVDGYDQVQDIYEADFGVVIVLNDEAARKAGITSTIEIETAERRIDGVPIGEVLDRYRRRIRAWESQRAG